LSQGDPSAPVLVWQWLGTLETKPAGRGTDPTLSVVPGRCWYRRPCPRVRAGPEGVRDAPAAQRDTSTKQDALRAIFQRMSCARPAIWSTWSVLDRSETSWRAELGCANRQLLRPPALREPLDRRDSSRRQQWRAQPRPDTTEVRLRNSLHSVGMRSASAVARAEALRKRVPVVGSVDASRLTSDTGYKPRQ
jgi:hypothetical protein